MCNESPYRLALIFTMTTLLCLLISVVTYAQSSASAGCDSLPFDVSSRWNALTARKVNAAAVADFNRDGKPDLAAVTSVDAVSVWMGMGDGSFSNAVRLALDFNGFAQADGIVSGDFNGDGHADLAALYHNGTVLHGVVVWPGEGNGRFSASRWFGLPDAFSIAAADFNRDGKLDLVVGITDGVTGLAVLLGDEVNLFCPWKLVETAFPHLLALADFNGDGQVDLATVQSDFVSVWQGDGAGGFSVTNSLRVAGRPVSLIAGDFNRDGRPDLAYAFQRQGHNFIEVWWNDGHVTIFGVAVPLSNMQAADFNRDGWLDLAAARESTDTIEILSGDGMGGFHLKELLVIGAAPTVLAARDVNGDGSPDLVTANNIAGSPLGHVDVFTNTCTAVIRDATNTRLDSLPNPAKVGQAIQFRIFVNAATSSSGTPTGQVQLWENGVPISPPLSLTNGKARFSTNRFKAGIHWITVRYGGDAAYLPSRDSTFQFVILPDGL